MFNKLDYVYAVYKEGSFTRAAEKLFISQPSLSAAVKNVEREVGAPLFDRSSGHVVPTEIGREYISAAERIMSIREEFVNRVNDIYALDVGHISVGGTNYLSSHLLPRIINKYTELYPKIEVTLTEANSRTLGELIMSEELDIVIDSFDEMLEDYDGYPLVSERILLCVPSEAEINSKISTYAIDLERIQSGDSSAFDAMPVPIEMLKDESFILLKNGNDMHHRAMKIFDEAKVTPRVIFSVDQLNISYALAESGMGVCFVTDTLLRYGNINNRVRIYNVGEGHSTRTLYVAHKKNKYRTSAMSKFIEIAREVVK